MADGAGVRGTDPVAARMRPQLLIYYVKSIVRDRETCEQTWHLRRTKLS